MHAEIAYLLELLGAFVRQQPAPALPPDTDTKKLLELAQNCNLSGVLGYMLLPQTATLGEDTVNLLSKHFFKTVAIFANRNTACCKLQQQLSDAGIPFALLKGAVLSQIYPAKELRTFGDIDVYIPPAYIPALRALLTAQGDPVTHEDDHQICISRSPLFVEFHFTLTADAPAQLPALHAYLENPAPHMTYWEPAGVHTVSPLYHFVYLLSHQMRHFESDSPGIRSYLDLAVLLQGGFVPDSQTLTDTLQQLGIYDFAAKALTLTEHWFHVPSPLPTAPLSKEDIAFIEDYLFAAGQFANKQNPRTYHVAQHGGRAPRLRALWRALFPPAKQMRSEKTYEKIARRFLPFAYIYRLFRGVFCRTSYAVSSAKAIATASEDAAARNRVKNIVGGTLYEKG